MNIEELHIIKEEQEDKEDDDDKEREVEISSIEEVQPFKISDSNFPIISDPGLNEIQFRYKDTKKAFHSDGTEKYKELCGYLGVVPITSFYERLSMDEIDLGYYGVNPKGVRAMADVLCYNAFVTKFSLEGNQLTCDAVYHLAEMLRENGMINYLNLKGCKIGHIGAKALAQGILSNNSLISLNLADNVLEDEGAKLIIKSFSEHGTLVKIILSNNSLTRKSATRLQKAIEENCILRELDLSWNYLNSDDGCKKLFAGMGRSTSIEKVNLSWNGLDELASRPIAICLGRNSTLQYLDISNNSFNDKDILQISRGLERNGSLKHLKIGMNPFSHEGAMGLLEALLNPKSCLEILDFENIMVEKQFKELLYQVLKFRQAQVHFVGYRSEFKIIGPNSKELLLKRAKFIAQKPKKHPKDFGQYVLKLGEMPIKKDDFEESLKKAKIKMDKDLKEEIIKAFKTKMGVNVKELKEQYLKIFPDTKLVEAKKKGKGKKGAKGKKGVKGNKK